MAKILLAEDDNLTRITLGRFLRAKGYEVELAENGGQAISLLNEHEFDLVISDLMMHNGDGWDLRDHVSSKSPGTPMLLMTAYAQVRSPQAGSGPMPEIILKPLVLTQLLHKIQQLLHQSET